MKAILDRFVEAAFLAAAEALGAHTVYSEDLSDGRGMDLCEW